MRIDIVGTGLGPGSITREGQQVIDDAGLLVGSSRLIEAVGGDGQTAVVASRPDEVIAAIEASRASRVAVLMSGDVGFHSGATKVADWVRASRPDIELRLVPGVSAVAGLAALAGVPWQDACLVSCHGSDTDLVSPVRRHRRTIALTGGNVAGLATSLADAGYGELDVWAGQDLGQPGESLTHTTIERLPGKPWSALTTLLIENPGFDDRTPAGLPDERFARGTVPMTKSAVRAIVAARLATRPADTCYDIGCGTGSVTVELALAAYAGRVFGVDKNPEAVGLTRQNCRAFHVGNVTAEQGSAPEALECWPAPDVAFIGGSSGAMREIVGAIARRNRQVRIAITAIAIESAAAAIDALAAAGFDPRVVQIGVAEGRATGGLHLMVAQNPVTLIYGGCDD